MWIPSCPHAAPAARKDRRPLLFYSAFLECPIAHDQDIVLSHLIVLNSPLEDIGAYAFERKPGFLLSDVFLNEVAKFAVGVSYRHGVIVVCH